MDRIAPVGPEVIGGSDPHQNLPTAAVVDGQGEVLGVQPCSATRAGDRALRAWMRGYGDLRRVGVASTGSYGTDLTGCLPSPACPYLT